MFHGPIFAPFAAVAVILPTVVGGSVENHFGFDSDFGPAVAFVPAAGSAPVAGSVPVVGSVPVGRHLGFDSVVGRCRGSLDRCVGVSPFYLYL